MTFPTGMATIAGSGLPDVLLHPWRWLEIDSALLPVAPEAEQKESDASFFENVLKVLKSNGRN